MIKIVAVFKWLLILSSIQNLCAFKLQKQSSITSMEDIISQLAASTTVSKFNVKTKQGYNMDCLKAIKSGQGYLGIFHSSRDQIQPGYNGLFYATGQNDAWYLQTKLSSRGSQGYIYQIPGQKAYLVLYQLQNHQKGNTIAIRYYESEQKLRINNFLYQYQLNKRISSKMMINVGTPSVEDIQIKVKEYDPKFNQYRLYIKFHYCPDGSHDYPGYGQVNLMPLRDFVDQKGNWKGGCKENYEDWQGFVDDKVQKAIRRIGMMGKIGQRDLFYLKQNGQLNKYYLYQVNLNQKFDWHNWRIVLYSEKDSRALQIPFEFNKVVDLANPHISLIQQQEGISTFWLSFFLPSEGAKPGTEAGEMIAYATLSL